MATTMSHTNKGINRICNDFSETLTPFMLAIKPNPQLSLKSFSLKSLGIFLSDEVYSYQKNCHFY